LPTKEKYDIKDFGGSGVGKSAINWYHWKFCEDCEYTMLIEGKMGSMMVIRSFAYHEERTFEPFELIEDFAFNF